MQVTVVILRWFIKLLANLSKLICYPFHWALPRKRFRIPARAAPLVKGHKNFAIPRIIWQTNFTDVVTLPVYLNYWFNRLMAPDFEHRFMITQQRTDFIRENCSLRIFDAYSRLQIGAAQADLWRVLVLYKYGGVYMDIDAHLVFPLGRMLPPSQEALFLQIKTGEISNYFIASKPESEHLAAIIEQIVRNIENDSSENVYLLTGPGVFNHVLGGRDVSRRYYMYTCNQGNFTNEYFQYVDKPQGKWTREQRKTPVLAPKPRSDPESNA